MDFSLPSPVSKLGEAGESDDYKILLAILVLAILAMAFLALAFLAAPDRDRPNFQGVGQSALQTATRMHGWGFAKDYSTCSTANQYCGRQ
jgi:hypothetical protein